MGSLLGPWVEAMRTRQARRTGSERSRGARLRCEAHDGRVADRPARHGRHHAPDALECRSILHDRRRPIGPPPPVIVPPWEPRLSSITASRLSNFSSCNQACAHRLQAPSTAPARRVRRHARTVRPRRRGPAQDGARDTQREAASERARGACDACTCRRQTAARVCGNDVTRRHVDGARSDHRGVVQPCSKRWFSGISSQIAPRRGPLCASGAPALRDSVALGGDETCGVESSYWGAIPGAYRAPAREI